MSLPEGLMNAKQHPCFCRVLLPARPHPWLGFYLRDDLTLERAQAVIKRLAAAASSSRYHSNSRNISEQARLSRSLWGSGEQLFNVCKSALKAGDGKWGRMGEQGWGFEQL